MAKRMTAESEKPAPANDPDEVIRQAVEDLLELESQKKQLNERMQEARAPIKAIMKMADFNAIFRLHKLEGDDRKAAIKAQRIMFEALELGGQSDLFGAPAAEAAKPGRSRKAPQPDDPPLTDASAKTLTEANQEGVRAGLAGKNRDSNPYPEGSDKADYWDRGYTGGQKQLAVQMGPAGRAPAGGPQPPAAA